MRQVRPGVWVDEPLPAHTTVVPKEWQLELTMGRDMPLPRAVIVNGVRYVPQDGPKDAGKRP
jgi:hypothetical protein